MWALLSMNSLHVVGTKNRVAAQVEVQVCIVVGGRAAGSGLEKRSRSAGRGASACGHCCRCIRYV